MNVSRKNWILPVLWPVLISMLLFVFACEPRYLLTRQEQNWANDSVLGYLTLDEMQEKLGPMKPCFFPSTRGYSALRLADSLKAAGIDTLLVFAKYSMSTKEPFGLPANFPLLPVAWSQPAYLFWIDSGRYFTLRVDQFGATKPRECEAFYQFPIYDYWFEHEREIGEFTCPTVDSARYMTGTYINQNGKRDTTYKMMKFHLPYLKTMYSPYYPVTDEGVLKLNTAQSSTKVTWDEYCFWPLGTTKESEWFPYYGVNDEPILARNSRESFQLNHQQAFFHFRLLIEAELFRLECANLLNCHTFTTPPDKKINKKTLRFFRDMVDRQ